MSKKESRASIIGSISNWIKLMALIVLVGEVIILFAMTKTSPESSLYIIYPIMMFVLLLVVIIAVIYDRTQVRNTQVALEVNQQQLRVSTNVETESLTDANSMFTNSLLGYEFELPSGNGWQEPRQMNYHQYFSEIMMQDGLDEDEFNKAVTTGSLLGPSFAKADVLSVMQGETMIVELDKDTSTEDVEQRLQIAVKQGGSGILDEKEAGPRCPRRR